MAVVLIVEDEVFIRQSAEWTIEDLGHCALVASDPDEARTQLSKSVQIDALFVDIRLGRVAQGGYAIADHAIQFRPGLRVLYTSGSPLDGEMTDQFVGGGQFLQKPYSSEQLETALAALLEPATP
jgi:CheY-like chemotaxis protein